MEHTCDVLHIEKNKLLLIRKTSSAAPELLAFADENIAVKLQQAKVLNETVLLRMREGQEFNMWIRDPDDDGHIR